MLTFILIF